MEERPAPAWRDSRFICCLADGDRHLGHIVMAGGYWLAFDATHLNEKGTGFRILGSCTSVAAAKRAVEQVLKADGGRARKVCGRPKAKTHHTAF